MGASGSWGAVQDDLEMPRLLLELRHLPPGACAAALSDPGLRGAVAYAGIATDDHNVDPPSELLQGPPQVADTLRDRKSTRLNSSHSSISYAVFCLKKKKKTKKSL